MQQPTLTNVRIRSTRDALQIFYAVARHILPMTTRRLDAEERRAITSGCVYVWEERCANSEATGMGMERWTDGMGWGPSRVRDEFLFYHQRENDVHEDPNNPSARWASIMRRRDARGNLPFSRSDAERLIKQTYSVHVSLPEDRPRGVTRKWHLTAYFSQTTIDSLGTIDDIPGVGDVVVPEGWFKSARASKANKRLDPPPVEDVGPTTHEPWGVVMPPASSHAVPPYGVETPPKWPNPPPRLSHSPHVGQSPYAVRSNTYPPVPRPYESPHHPGHALPPPASQYPHGPAPLPNMHDTGLSIYRDPSPYAQSSSSSSDPGFSPRPLSSPLTPPSNVSLPLGMKAEKATPQLVPLSYLQGLQQRPRDPMDEQYLKRFSSPDIPSHDLHRHSCSSLTGRRPLCDRFAEDESKPALVQSSRW
ncbi:Gti1/Pac2 family-domain-containing protein [Trametes punicea]|nr:Gti1/Pac2 family-domain-containing protein [Trametes punicea]